VAAAISADGRAAEADALDTGMLAVARVDPRALALAAFARHGAGGAGSASAGQRAGATPFEMPDGIAVTARGVIYLACTGTPGLLLLPGRRSGTAFGQVLKIDPAGGDPAAPTASVRLFLQGGDA
jgi:secreted PhoX family phosphatase